MSVMMNVAIECPCGNKNEAILPRSVNATRSPHLRAAVLDRTLHSIVCASCDRRSRAEFEFAYLDQDRGYFIYVLPKRRSNGWLGASDRLVSAVEQTGVDADDLPIVRVVAGIDALREKILCIEEGLDDQQVELAKVAMLSEHPFLLKTRGLELRVDQLDDDRVSLVASHTYRDERYSMFLPRSSLERCLAEIGTAKSPLGSDAEKLFGPERDTWVDLRRWAPSSWGLAALSLYAKRARNGDEIDTSTKEFNDMLAALPRSSDLESPARADLRALRDYALDRGDVALQDALFEIRFGIVLEDEWGQVGNDADIVTLWELLRNLPASDVEGNTALAEIRIETDPSESSSYDPNNYVIEMSEWDVNDPGWFEWNLRHEVGHAVEERSRDEVETWLWEKCEWAWYDDSDESIDLFIEFLMGGWGDATAAERRDVRLLMRECLGPGRTFDKPKAPTAPGNHLWNSPGFLPKKIFDQTPSDWYETPGALCEVDGWLFFVNFNYREFQAVPREILDAAISATGKNYCAASPWEFFAELYAAHHDDGLAPLLSPFLKFLKGV